MNNLPKYSLLKYVHSEYLGEEIVLGILFVFPKHQKVHFSYPKSLKRINGLYSDFNIRIINAYLEGFYHKCGTLNNQLNHDISVGDVDKLIKKEFLADTACSIKFDASKSFYQSGFETNEDSINRYEGLYLNEYFINEDLPLKKDEIYLNRTIKHLLSRKKSDISAYLNPGFDLEPPDRKAELKVDFWYQNNSKHLVKSISFDLAESGTINHKAVLNFGLLNFVAEYAKSKKYTFDILVSAPQKDDENLIDSYRRSIEILKSSNADCTVYQENELESYADKVVKDIEDHNK